MSKIKSPAMDTNDWCINCTIFVSFSAHASISVNPGFFLKKRCKAQTMGLAFQYLLPVNPSRCIKT